MTDEVILALIVGLPPTIVALGGIIVQIITAYQNRQHAREEADTVAKKLELAKSEVKVAADNAAKDVSDKVIEESIKSNEKLDHITSLTNSNLTKANERIDDLEKMIRGLLVEGGTKAEKKAAIVEAKDSLPPDTKK